jgi:hypothetical protein
VDDTLVSNMWNLAFDSKERAAGNEGSSISSYSYEEHEAYMSGIQRRRMVDKMAREASSQGTDGDNVIAKDGESSPNSPKALWKLELQSALSSWTRCGKSSISMKEMMQFSDRRMEPLGS